MILIVDNKIGFEVKEPLTKLEKALKEETNETVQKRLQVLISYKKKEGKSVKTLSEQIKMSVTTIWDVRKRYSAKDGGLAKILIPPASKNKKLTDAHKNLIIKYVETKGTFKSYMELKAWIKSDLGITISYSGLLAYAKKNLV